MTDGSLLPLRPRPAMGEATPGYLMRVAASNGFRTATQMLAFLSDPHFATFDDLVTRLGLSDDERHALFGALPRRWGHAEMPLGLSVSDFNHVHRRWCPMCLAETGVLQGRWTLKLTTACTKHAVWLEEVCPNCQSPQAWTDVDFMHCACGMRLTGTRVADVDAGVVALLQVLGGESPENCALPDAFSALPVPLAHKVVRYLGHFIDQPRPAHPGQVRGVHQLQTAKTLISNTVQLLTDWPSRLHGLMATLQATAPNTPSVRRTFSPLYRVLYTELDDPRCQFLRDGFEAYLHEHWWGLVCQRNKLIHSQTIASHPRVTIKEAAKATETPASVIRHLVQADLIDGTATPLPSGRQQRTVHAQEMAAIKAITQGACTLQAAAQALALPESRVRMLLAHGIVKPAISRLSNRLAQSWLIPQAEIQRLHLTPVVGDVQAHRTLRDTLKYGQLSDDEAMGMIRAVIDGELLVRSTIADAVPIGLACLDRGELAAWLLTTRRQSSPGLSVDEAAQALGLKQQVAYELVRRGLLPSKYVAGLGRRVFDEAIQSFRQTYVSLAEIARLRGRAPRALLHDIEGTPVTGPSVDGARQYFFRRSDLVHPLM